jgi:hypothetical protein
VRATDYNHTIAPLLMANPKKFSAYPVRKIYDENGTIELDGAGDPIPRRSIRPRPIADLQPDPSTTHGDPRTRSPASHSAPPTRRHVLPGSTYDSHTPMLVLRAPTSANLPEFVLKEYFKAGYTENTTVDRTIKWGDGQRSRYRMASRAYT